MSILQNYYVWLPYFTVAGTESPCSCIYVFIQLCCAFSGDYTSLNTRKVYMTQPCSRCRNFAPFLFLSFYLIFLERFRIDQFLQVWTAADFIHFWGIRIEFKNKSSKNKDDEDRLSVAAKKVTPIKMNPMIVTKSLWIMYVKNDWNIERTAQIVRVIILRGIF